ncbi:MAG: hypothetical protein ACE5KE_12010 [Methanosarcinales archaeon]
MASRNKKNITLPRPTINQKEGVVILPLKKWKEIEDKLEDLEMMRSKKLAKEIAKARAEVKRGAVVTLEELEKGLK